MKNKHAKSEALDRKKMEKETDNICKECGSKKHATKDHKEKEEDEEEEEEVEK